MRVSYAEALEANLFIICISAISPSLQSDMQTPITAVMQLMLVGTVLMWLCCSSSAAGSYASSGCPAARCSCALTLSALGGTWKWGTMEHQCSFPKGDQLEHSACCIACADRLHSSKEERLGQSHNQDNSICSPSHQKRRSCQAISACLLAYITTILICM